MYLVSHNQTIILILTSDLKSRLLAQARAEGFSNARVTKPDNIPEVSDRLNAFLKSGFHGQMDWLENRQSWRSAPKALWPEVQSVLMLSESYAPKDDALENLKNRNVGNISVYARGKDYHDVVKKRLKRLASWLISEGGGNVKVFVDTAPVAEKPLAQAAGLGWQGKHTNLVSKEFTAKMEDGLDEVSRGELDAVPFMTNFYKGGGRFAGLENMLEEKVDIPTACSIMVPEVIADTTEGRIGRYGPYLRRGDDTRSIPEDIYMGDLTLEIIENIFSQEAKEDESLGNDPETGESIWIKKGPYGHYVQLGETKTRKGIPKNYDLNSVDLEYALKLLSLPRDVGVHPDTNEMVTADYGRYGPYIRCGKQNAPIRGAGTPLDITLEQSIELLANKNKKTSELRSLGKHPETNEDIVVKDGRYGPYISDGKVNAALKGNLSPETITLDEAVELINNRRQNPPKKRKKKKKK